jgi:hypothetical protein
MSLINDALKRASQAPPRTASGGLAPLPQPAAAAKESSSVRGWLISVIVILLIVAGIFFAGLATSRHTIPAIAAVPDTNTVNEKTTDQPAVEVATAVVPAPEPPAPVTVSMANPPSVPKLQGIFYSPTDPTAIVEGKMLGLGAQFRQYRVKAITKYAVTLVGPDQQEIKLSMSN